MENQLTQGVDFRDEARQYMFLLDEYGKIESSEMRRLALGCVAMVITLPVTIPLYLIPPIRGLLDSYFDKREAVNRRRNSEIYEKKKSLEDRIERIAGDIHSLFYREEEIDPETLFELASFDVPLDYGGLLLTIGRELPKRAASEYVKRYGDNVENLEGALGFFGKDKSGRPYVDANILAKISELRSRDQQSVKLDEFLMELRNSQYKEAVKAIEEGKRLKLVTGSPYGMSDGIAVVD